ncbi:MAG: Dyp-type peroxidase [Microthrixaceae bacterium]|nr:Dyp-type peroxidase [Microthrixaceae bacterium]
MPTPQPGIFAQGTLHHRHLELDLIQGVDDAALGSAVESLVELFAHPGGVNLVVGFGAEAWRRIADPEDIPDGLAPFDVAGLASTQHDIWVWLHGNDAGGLFDAAYEVVHRLSPVASLASETAGFAYHDSRDLSGFVDGTENPGLDEAFEVAIIADGEPGAGGSFALAQRWVHDLAAFGSLDVAEQESVIGRTKLTDEELDPRPATSHLGRVVVEDEEGEEMEIYRRSVPYGGVGEHGLFFLAFSSDPQRVRVMLERMFGQTDDGLADRLTEFSTPVSGANYFVPAVGSLPGVTS